MKIKKRQKNKWGWEDHTKLKEKHSCQSHLEVDQLIYSPAGLCQIQTKNIRLNHVPWENGLEISLKAIKWKKYMDCRFFKSPTADEISPPKFKFDKFLQETSKMHQRRPIWIMHQDTKSEETMKHPLAVGKGERKRRRQKLTEKQLTSWHCHRKLLSTSRNQHYGHRPSRGVR